MDISSSSINSVKKCIVDSYDMANGNKVFYVNDITSWKKVSVHLEWSGLDHTDAVVQIQQTNDKSLALLDITDLNATLNTTSGGYLLENTEWGGVTMGIKITVNSVTEGSLKIYLTLKK